MGGWRKVDAACWFRRDGFMTLGEILIFFLSPWDGAGFLLLLLLLVSLSETERRFLSPS